jgi:glycosidase
MIDAAHAKGIKVVMDMIFNHSGSSHWWITDVPTSDWFNQNDQAVKTGERIKEQEANRGKQQQQQRQFSGYRRQQVQMPATVAEFEALPQEQKDALIRQHTHNEDALVTTTHYKWTLLDPHAPQTEKDILVQGWFSGGMPDLNQKNRHLGTYLIQNSIWWIEYSRIDGIRMDTYPYADFDFMARWCEEINNEYPDFNIVGEGWYPRNSAAGWWQGGSTVHNSDSKLKTVMDFDLTFTTQNEILKESNTSEGSEAGLFKMYECVTQDFLIPDPNYVLTFLDNHDIARFMKPGDPIWKFKQGLAFLLTTRGIPQIYYGTEIMMGVTGTDQMRADFPGGWAEDEKSAFTAEGRTLEQNESWNFASTLLNWRRTSKAVAEGKLIHYTPDNRTKCYVYARTNGEETVLVILNGSDTMRLVDMHRFSEVVKDNIKGKDVVTGEVVDLTSLVKIEPRGVYVLELSK